ncbi:MAG: NlpC/P60 family protein [Parvibaculaceae bacterium]|nr:NlpC/P60 family protein [Parvibaculaceae bacterium]
MIAFHKIPYVDGGRDVEGCDCWGLVRLYLFELAGLELPTYGTIGATEFAQIDAATAQGAAGAPWGAEIQPGSYKKGDVALLKSVARVDGKSVVLPVHMGVFVDGQSVMHTEPELGVQVLPVSSPFLKRRLITVRRHEQLV